MNYKLVIAEKPSVAKTIADVLGSKERKDGFIIGNGYIVSWCIGHLITLAKAESYDKTFSRWRYTDLPIIPDNWKYSVSEDKIKQIELLSKLMNKSDIDVVINACDAGREGELIFRLVYDYCKCDKDVKRLWISSMEEKAISEGFNNLKSGTEYDNLYKSALCRAKADWIVGINATRLFSILYDDTLNVGRVQSPTLSLIAERESGISNFVKESFYVPVIECDNFTAEGEKTKDKEYAEKIIADCDGKPIVIKSVEKQKKTISCYKLFDLTSLQREANRIFGYTAQQTLDYVQSLYEKKLTTYPRTDSRYLTGDMENGIKPLAEIICSSVTFLNSIKLTVNTKQVIDNSKVTDHHAIIPTISIKNADISSLPTGEKNILYMICTRFICAVGNKCEYDETIINIECDGNIFTAKGRTIINDGFKLADKAFRDYYKHQEENTSENIVLPNFTEGEILHNAAVCMREGVTSPPKSYTEDTLLKAMETAGTDELIETAERKGIGTPATRAGIIEKLVKSKFIERKGRKLLPTQKGINLISVLPDMLKSPYLTAEWENKLKKVEYGELTADDFINDIRDFITEIITENTIPKQEYKALFSSNQINAEPVGICPRCKNKVYESKRGFFCENTACEFGIWKENVFFASKRVTVTRNIVETLLKEGRIFMPELYSEKMKKTYSATIHLNDGGGKYVSFRLDFSKPKI